MTICRGFKKFKDGESVIKDGRRPGRPTTSVTKSHVAAVKELIEKDGRYAVQDIARQLGISQGSVHIILTKKLGLRKICARWVPHLLTTEQKKKRVGCSKKLLKHYLKYNTIYKKSQEIVMVQ